MGGTACWGGDGWGSGKIKGKGKGKGKKKGSFLFNAPYKTKVWIGGLPETKEKNQELNDELKQHMSVAGECKYAEVGRGGLGGACFETEDEVTNAIAMLNGSIFKDVVIQV